MEMRSVSVMLGMVSTIAFADSSVKSERIEAEGISFAAPGGWKQRQVGETWRFEASAVPEGQSCYIAVMPTVPLKQHSPESVFGLLQEPDDTLKDSGIILGKTKHNDTTLSEEKVVLHGSHHSSKIWRGYYSVVLEGQLSGVLLSATTQPLFEKGMAAARGLVESMRPKKP